MKTILQMALGLLLMAAATGCAAGAAAAATGSSGATIAATPTPAGGPTIEITDTVRLIVGTMKLGDAGLAPDAAEAAKLIPLWQAYQSLSRSDATAPQELQALLAQIRDTMSAEQLKAIDGMTLTQDDVRSIFESLRQNSNGSNGGTSGNGFNRNGRPGEGFRQFGGGDGPFGGPPGGGGFSGGQGGSGLTPQQLATAQARRASRAQNGNRSGLFLIGPLIANLQTLAGS